MVLGAVKVEVFWEGLGGSASTSVKTSVSEAQLRWLTELIFQIGHSVGILECQRRPPGLQMNGHSWLEIRVFGVREIPVS